MNNKRDTSPSMDYYELRRKHEQYKKRQRVNETPVQSASSSKSIPESKIPSSVQPNQAPVNTVTPTQSTPPQQAELPKEAQQVADLPEEVSEAVQMPSAAHQKVRPMPEPLEEDDDYEDEDEDELEENPNPFDSFINAFQSLKKRFRKKPVEEADDEDVFADIPENPPKRGLFGRKKAEEDDYEDDEDADDYEDDEDADSFGDTASEPSKPAAHAKPPVHPDAADNAEIEPLDVEDIEEDVSFDRPTIAKSKAEPAFDDDEDYDDFDEDDEYGEEYEKDGPSGFKRFLSLFVTRVDDEEPAGDEDSDFDEDFDEDTFEDFDEDEEEEAKPEAKPRRGFFGRKAQEPEEEDYAEDEDSGEEYDFVKQAPVLDVVDPVDAPMRKGDEHPAQAHKFSFDVEDDKADVPKNVRDFDDDEDDYDEDEYEPFEDESAQINEFGFGHFVIPATKAVPKAPRSVEPPVNSLYEDTDEFKGGSEMDDNNKLDLTEQLSASLETSGMSRRERRELAERKAKEEAAKLAAANANQPEAFVPDSIEDVSAGIVDIKEASKEDTTAAYSDVFSAVDEPTREFKPVSKKDMFDEDEGEDEEEEKPARKFSFRRSKASKPEIDDEDDEDEDADDFDEEEEKPRRGFFGKKTRKDEEEGEDDEDYEDDEDEEDDEYDEYDDYDEYGDEDDYDEDDDDDDQPIGRHIIGFFKGLFGIILFILVVIFVMNFLDFFNVVSLDSMFERYHNKAPAVMDTFFPSHMLKQFKAPEDGIAPVEPLENEPTTAPTPEATPEAVPTEPVSNPTADPAAQNTAEPAPTLDNQAGTVG